MHYTHFFLAKSTAVKLTTISGCKRQLPGAHPSRQVKNDGGCQNQSDEKNKDGSRTVAVWRKSLLYQPATPTTVATII